MYHIYLPENNITSPGVCAYNFKLTTQFKLIIPSYSRNTTLTAMLLLLLLLKETTITP